MKQLLFGLICIIVVVFCFSVPVYLYQSAYEEGKQSFIRGLNIESNPYICVFSYDNTVNQIQLKGWFKGYLDEKQKCGAQSIQEKPSPPKQKEIYQKNQI